MSGAVVGWAMEQVTGSPAAKLVLAKLADNANEQGLCWPSIDLIIEHTELGQSTVYKHLAKLEELGLIRPIDITVHGAPMKGFQLAVPEANREIPPRGKHKPAIPRGGNDFPRGGNDSPPDGKNIPPGGMPYKEEPSSEPSIEPPPEPSRGRAKPGVGAPDSPTAKSKKYSGKYSDAFERFWTEVRKWPEFSTIWSKPHVFDAWRALEADEALLGPGEMVAAAREYGREKARLNAEALAARKTPQHTKHPANFLREKLFLGLHEALAEQALDAEPPKPVRLDAADADRLRAAGLDDARIASWFGDGRFERRDGAVIFRAATQFKADRIAQQFSTYLERAFGRPVHVALDVEATRAA